MQVERSFMKPSGGLKLSGGRVSNAWVTCLIQGDNSWKRLLIPDDVGTSHGVLTKGLLDRESLAAYQLVGGVTAYQGIDG